MLDDIRGPGGSAEFLPLDLGDLANVKRCAELFLAKNQRLDVLVNNAGLAGSHGLTKDGFELAFGTNYLGPFLLTLLLLPRLRASAPARIVNVSSDAHYREKTIDFAALQRPTASRFAFPEYSVSKLCNVLFTKELARGRAGAGVHSYALNPGVVASDIWRQVPWPFRFLGKLFMVSNQEGAETSLYCATSAAIAEHDGRYYDQCREKRSSKWSDDPALARQLWEKSEQWVASYLRE